MTDRDLYSIEQARFRLGGISRKTLYYMLNAGDLTSVVLGRRRFIPADAIARLIANASANVLPSDRTDKSLRVSAQDMGRTKEGALPARATRAVLSRPRR